MENEIINITDLAWKEILRVFHEEEQKAEESKAEIKRQGVRLAVVGGGCSGLSYKVDFSEAKENDYIFTRDERDILIDPKSAIYLKGLLLDFKDGLQGRGFVFNNPNAKSSCGCGESFSL